LKKPRHISRVLATLLKDLNIERSINNWRVIEKWSEIVGERIAFHAKAVGVDRECLFVEVDDPTWQSQLFLMKNDIIGKCHKYGVFLKEIKFHIGKHEEA
jgi:predicted nucleic acid-binding Zn ribbon protein